MNKRYTISNGALRVQLDEHGLVVVVLGEVDRGQDLGREEALGAALQQRLRDVVAGALSVQVGGGQADLQDDALRAVDRVHAGLQAQDAAARFARASRLR